MDIGSGFKKMAVARLRTEAREIVAHLKNGSGEVITCPAHKDIAAAGRLSLEMLDVILESTTSQTKAAVIGASVGSGIGVAVGAVVMTVLKAFAGGG
jgi:hypothetical protein